MEGRRVVYVMYLCTILKLCPVSSKLDKNNTKYDMEKKAQTHAVQSNGLIAKFVNHTHEHFGDVVSSTSDTSREEGMYFVKMIFERFGEENEMSTDDLKKLFVDIGIRLNNKDGHGNHTESAGVDDGGRKHRHHRHAGHGSEEGGPESRESAESEKDEDSGMKDEKNGEAYRSTVSPDEVSDHIHHDKADMEEHTGHTNSHLGQGAEDRESLPERTHKKNHAHTSGRTGHHHGRDWHKGTPHHEPHLRKNHVGCFDVPHLLNLYQLEHENHLTPEQFLHLSPAIIYQLNNVKCRITRHTDHVHMKEETSTSETVGFDGIPAIVWGYSTLAVVIISLVGLLGVAVIPIMQKVFYNHLLQFLVAMAVGALTGDALLHLLPHAIAGVSLHESDDNHAHGSNGNHSSHQPAVLKGLCGLGGFFFFFLTERMVMIFSAYKKKRKRRRATSKRISAIKDDTYTAKKLAAYDERGFVEGNAVSNYENTGDKYLHKGAYEHASHTIHEENYKKCKLHSSPHTAEEEGMLSVSHSHIGHTHGDSSEMVPQGVASVAWMVILGDGIHNFSDGLAIGAAFANSITGGVSTAIAVFCHELPHEIGDFAVLLRAGMSIKQAIVYNILSSVLCLLGMFIGVAVGNNDQVSQWVFAGIAGTFIYIAMVDMLPEMTSLDSKDGEYTCCHLLLHCLGMMLGVGIMLTIALYEKRLLTLLDNQLR